MKEFKGTGGNWKRHDKAYACVISENGEVVANCGNKTSNVRSEELFVENEANANLTAAAPEMGTMLQDSTDALKSLLALFGDSISTTTRFGVSQQIKENELVINKAFGL